MSITNSQYNSIMREYDRTRTKNQHILTARHDEIYAMIPAYKDLENQISSLCVLQLKKSLSGDTKAIQEMKEKLKELSLSKTALLTQSGFSSDYLDPIYTCPDCKDTGYLPNREKCHCLKEQISSLLYDQSGIKDLLEQENFSTLSTEYYQGEDLKNFNNAVEICHKYVTDFKTAYQNIIFCGTVGTGKSFLTNCIAKELLDKGNSILYFSAPALFQRMADYTFCKPEDKQADSFYSDLLSCDLLIIDDLGTEVTNRLINSELISLLNERTIGRKSMIISTNLPLGELADRYSERIFSRVVSNFEVLELTGPDIRIQKKMTLRK